MKSWMIDVAKEIILEKQEAHITAYKVHTLQNRLDAAFQSDTSHTTNLSA